ncbi:hypothetical protein JQ597_04570 [Bradyrhizobium sp. AUGA SZCCT0177]|uniref:hypothetical protein n=1 Tax=Bradyrhizobium sp. AUGA SZCCT0177 TaxID=2807665 RepID=UPI001BA5BB5B|nr:hypothetical protein [Bradyrhizobium sp. AUGA SZCCT0177]MBR1281309.1 hypothetical protein [Bradyrhizobium sp. AUGA SZCCT0177]
MAWDWKKTAEEARHKLGSAKHGSREAALKAAGGSRDVNTVRRAVAALDFLDRVKVTHPESYSVLKDSPFGVVETFARWWSSNPADAALGLAKWKNGGLTTRGIADSMRKSRPPAVEAANDESLVSTFSEYAEPRIRQGIETTLGTEVTPSADKRSLHRPPVDFRYIFKDSFGGGDRQAAAIVVGPYQNQTIYRKRRHDWMLKALGLTYFFDLVFVVLPGQSPADDYTAWIERARAQVGSEPLAYGMGTPADSLSRLRILVVQ